MDIKDLEQIIMLMKKAADHQEYTMALHLRDAKKELIKILGDKWSKEILENIKEEQNNG